MIIWKTVKWSTCLHSFVFVLFRYSSPKFKRIVSIFFYSRQFESTLSCCLCEKHIFLFHFKVTSTWHICFSENNLHVRRQVSNSITQKPQVFFLINNKHIKISWNLFISLHLHFFFLFLQWRIYLDLYKSKKLNWCQSKHSFIFMKSECRFDCFFISNCHEQDSTCLTFTHIFFFTSKQIFFFLINFLLLFFWCK